MATYNYLTAARIETIRKMAAEPQTQVAIAKEIGVCRNTIRVWMKYLEIPSLSRTEGHKIGVATGRRGIHRHSIRLDRKRRFCAELNRNVSILRVDGRIISYSWIRTG
jgi:hypothetical protein